MVGCSHQPGSVQSTVGPSESRKFIHDQVRRLAPQYQPKGCGGCFEETCRQRSNLRVIKRLVLGGFAALRLRTRQACRPEIKGSQGSCRPPSPTFMLVLTNNPYLVQTTCLPASTWLAINTPPPCLLRNYSPKLPSPSSSRSSLFRPRHNVDRRLGKRPGHTHLPLLRRVFPKSRGTIWP